MGNIEFRCPGCDVNHAIPECCAQAIAHELHERKRRADAEERGALIARAATEIRERAAFNRKHILVNCPHCTGCGFRDLRPDGARRYHCGLVLAADGRELAACANSRSTQAAQRETIPLSAVEAMLSAPGLTLDTVRLLARALGAATSTAWEVVPTGDTGVTLKEHIK